MPSGHSWMNSLRRRCSTLSAFACLALAGAAHAQRADENAITSAQDAFGTSVGFQNVGLYSPNDARGLSPQHSWAGPPQIHHIEIIPNQSKFSILAARFFEYK